MRINHDVALLPDMALFAQVVEASSFSEVARKRGMTPSAVSRSIARLERATGTRLLHRTTRKLSLSEAGTEMYQHCRDMLDAARSALQVAHQREMRPAGKLRVSSPRALGRFFVHPHIAPFLRTYPDVDVELRLDDRPLDLYDGDIDLAFRVTDDPPASLMGRKLFRIEHVICSTPAYLDQHGRPQHPRDLKGHSCIALSRAVDDSRWRFTRAGKTISVDIEGRYTVNHAGVRLDAVLSGIGFGSLSFFMARDALEAGLIEQVLPAWAFKTNYHGDVWLLYPPTRYLPAKARCFIDFIAERLQA